jgi:hypothetical protein
MAEAELILTVRFLPKPNQIKVISILIKIKVVFYLKKKLRSSSISK